MAKTASNMQVIFDFQKVCKAFGQIKNWLNNLKMLNNSVLSDEDDQILKDYLTAYKISYEALTKLTISLSRRVLFTEEERELARVAEVKHKTMLYHFRKWNPDFRKIKK